MLEVEEKEKENRSDPVDVYSAVMWYRHVPEFPHWDKSETAAVSGNQKWGKIAPRKLRASQLLPLSSNCRLLPAAKRGQSMDYSRQPEANIQIGLPSLKKKQQYFRIHFETPLIQTCCAQMQA